MIKEHILDEVQDDLRKIGIRNWRDVSPDRKFYAEVLAQVGWVR